jgi:succinyl-diaminopimelate desuccinylase
MNSIESIATAVAQQFPRQVQFLQRLIQTKSVNPFPPDHLLPDIPIETEVAAVIQDELDSLNLPSQLAGVSPQRSNVLSYLKGSGNMSKTLLLTTHMDTVDPSHYTRDPWQASLEQGRLYGVGAGDAKAQIAAFLYAVAALRKAAVPVRGDIVLAFVVDEESGACSPYGTRYLLEQGLLTGDAAMVGEPGDDKISIGHRGLYRFRLRTQGEAVHTGMKAWEEGTQGHNAIVDMARIIVALTDCHLPVVPSAAFPHRKQVLTFPTLIEGGSGINVVPGECEAYGDVRLLPGTSSDEIRKRIIAQLDQRALTNYHLEDLLLIPAAETDPESPIVDALSEAVKAVTGMSLRKEGSGPACDGWMFITRGIPTICGYGVKCGGVHGADEWVDLDSLRTVTQVYAHTILRYFEQE